MTSDPILFDSSRLHVFAYGSNMLIRRMRDRIAAASVIQKGSLAGHKLAFHKRGVDGSAKANALFTGEDADRVWGVLYRVSHRDSVILDRIETVGSGYDREEVEVMIADRTVRAHTYVARSEVIDDSLKPFSWYHQLVLHGALQHELPDSYIDSLARIESIADPDQVRDRQHRELIGNK